MRKATLALPLLAGAVGACAPLRDPRNPEPVAEGQG